VARLVALTAVALIGWADFESGPDIGFSLLYLVPVVAIGWLDGAVSAVLIALAGSLAWFQADYLWHHTSLGVTAWNSLTRLIIFMSMGILMARLRRDRERLRAANDELESFTYSVSHDLRSPLHHIGSFAAMLRERPETRLDEEGRRHLASISDSAAVALKLIDDLLSFSHLGKSQIRRSPVDLSELVESAREDVCRSAPERSVAWNVGRLPLVQGDPSMLRIAVQNLIENAFKYTRPREQALIEVGSRPDAHSVVVYVRDNGVGFDPQYAGKLFRVFERLHRQNEFEGTGIGLAIVNRVITRHGGRTWAEGEVGRGATFYFSLPVS
jgi:light-regulated signal transduction histidine kinase (bacteriophytochrome)